MEKVDDFSDVRHKAWCIHCGESLAQTATNADHVPTQGFLQKPRPSHLPVVPICQSCNSSFSIDEEYMIAFLSIAICGSSELEKQKGSRIGRMLQRHTKLRNRIDNSKTEYETIGGDKKVFWVPERDRIERVVIKNARGQVFFECGEPIFEAPAHVFSVPLGMMAEQQRQDFELVDDGNIARWPEVGSRLLTRMCTGEDMEGSWIVVQDHVYRYAINFNPPIRVRTVISEYLATEVVWESA